MGLLDRFVDGLVAFLINDHQVVSRQLKVLKHMVEHLFPDRFTSGHQSIFDPETNNETRTLRKELDLLSREKNLCDGFVF